MHPVPALGLANSFERDRRSRQRAVRARSLSHAPSGSTSHRARFRLSPEEPDVRSRPAKAGGERLTVRRAQESDASAVLRLAQLDGSSPESADLAEQVRAGGPASVLVAEADGEMVAALDLESGRPVADAFRPTSAATELLRVRARQLRGGDARPRGPLGDAVRARLHPKTG